MKPLLAKLLFFLGFVVAACGTQDSSSLLSLESDNSYQELAEAPPTSQETTEDTDISDRKIIREGEIYFESREIQETEAFLKSEVKAAKGFIANESENSYEDRTEKRLSIRIPSDQLDPLVEKIHTHALRIENITIRSEDVTEQYIDVEARLKTKKALENRYTELLNLARNVDEILQLERELANVRGEIESMQGRLNYLKDRVDLSTLTISFFVENEKEFGFPSKAIDSLKNGWTNLQWFFIFILNLWPFFLIAGGLLFWLLKRKKTPPPPMR